MESWRDVEARSGGMEAENGALEGLVDQWSQIHVTLMMSRIRIRIEVMRIRKPVLYSYIWDETAVGKKRPKLKKKFLQNLQFIYPGFRIRINFSCWIRIQEGKNYPQK